MKPRSLAVLAIRNAGRLRSRPWSSALACAASIAALAGCNGVIAAAPSIAGPDASVVDVSIPDPDQWQPPGDCVRIDPAAVDFGDYRDGCPSLEMTVTVSNGCGGAVRLDSLQVVGSEAFAISRRPALPAVIPAGRVATIGIQYSSDHGDSATLQVEFAGGAGPIEVALTGVGGSAPREVDTFPPDLQFKVDVLFVIDDSPAMADKQASLKRNLASIFRYQILVHDEVDFRVAVTTTSTRGPNAANGRLLPLDGPGSRVITRGTPNAESAFAALADVGAHGDTTAELLKPIQLALSEPLLSGHNAGFLRPEARLAILVISASADTSGTSVDDYEQFLLSIKGSRRRSDTWVSGVIPTLAVAPTNGCSYATPDAGQWMKVRSLVERMGGGLDEICNPEFGRPYGSGWERRFGNRTTFFLSHPPQPGTIVVRLDDAEYPRVGSKGDTRWDYDSALNAVVFDFLAAPLDSATVTIEYVAGCES